MLITLTHMEGNGMTTDLSGYKLSELKELQHDVEKEIMGRQQQEVKNAREQILSHRT
jgi:hypothetical protein